MKIAMIGQKGIPAKSGGVEKHVEEISKRLVSLGHDVIVYSRNSYIKDDIKELNGVKVKLVKTINTKSLDAIVYTFNSTIRAIIENCDIYHYHAIGPALFCWIPRLLGKKVVVTIHGLDWQRDKWGKFAKLSLKLGERIAGKFANGIISVSKNLREYFVTNYRRNDINTVFIANGVEVKEKLEINEIKKFGLEKEKYILFLARLTPEKGVHYLIDSYNNANVEEKLVIAGGSSFTDEYVDKLKLKAKRNEKIIFTGTVSGDILIELYSNCLFYVLPSDVEGMPLTLLEAMSFEKLALVSNIPENLSVIMNPNVGVSFEKGNVEDLKNKIESLVKNKQSCISIEKKAKEEIIKKYNWNIVCKETEMLYKSLLGE